MLWELLRYPSGDVHAQLYWRRRMSVLAVLSVILLLVLVLAFRGGDPDVSPASAEVTTTEAAGNVAGGDPAALPPPAPGPSAVATPSASASPTPRPSPSASPSPAADPATDCPPGSMALRLSSDAPTYSDGRQPVLTLSVVDIGTSPCTVDLGTTATTISVLSAGKPIWTSNACVPKQQRPTPLSPAAAQMLQLRWDLSQNAKGCEASATPPAPGQYEIVARVGNTAAYGGNFELR